MRPGRALAGALSVLALAGCGSAEGRAELPPAAEPAASPPLTEPPAGRVVPVGRGPEGLAADPATGLVAVGLRDPDRLALVDGRSGRVEHRVRIPESPRHLDLAAPGGPVLVPAERADTLAVVELPSGRVSREVRVGRFPHDAAAGGGRLYVANEFGDSISVVERGRVTRTLRAPVQPGNVATLPDGTVVVIAVRSNALQAYDGRDLRSLGVRGAGAGPTHVVADRPNRLYVADTRGDALILFSVNGREIQAYDRINLPGTPYGLALDAPNRRLYVTLTARNLLLELALEGHGPRAVREVPTVRQPNTVAVDPRHRRVYVAGRSGGELQIIEPGDGRRLEQPR